MDAICLKADVGATSKMSIGGDLTFASKRELPQIAVRLK